MPLGSELVSTIAATGMLSRCASWIAMSSLLVSITKIMSGRPPISLMPPSERSSLSRSRCSVSRSFLVSALASPDNSTSPTRVEEILRRAFCGFGDAVLPLSLGADEQHPPALGDGVADRLQRAMQHRHGL